MRALAFAVLISCGAPSAPVATPPAPPPAIAQVTPSPPACTSAGAVREIVDASGDKLSVVPVETWYTAGAAWVGDELAVVRRYAEVPYGQRVQDAIERWAPDGKAAKSRALIAADARAISATPDGSHLVLGSDGRIAIVDAATGAEDVSFAITGTPGAVLATSKGEVLATLGNGATLFDRGGTELETFALTGTTPTIKRVYGVDPDHPTVHSNILGTTPSWAVSLAASPDGKTFAIGGSDSKVRVFGPGGMARLLEHKWTYVEQRHMGGNPDLDEPLAMRFSDDGKQLFVVYAHGEAITWDIARGTQLTTLDGKCAPSEADIMANLYADRGEPRRAPTADDLAACTRATTAVIAPDGSWVATGIGVVRVRALPSGAPLAMIKEVTLPGVLAASRGGTLAMVDIYGRTTVWSRAGGVAELLAPARSSPRSPRLSASGRILSFEVSDGRSFTWDLATGAELARVVAASDDASRTVVALPGGGYELHDGRRTQRLLWTGGHVAFSTNGERLLHAASNDYVVRDFVRNADTVIHAPGPAVTWALSPNGHRLATYSEAAQLQVWDTTTGRALATFGTGVRAAALSSDGRRIAWVTVDAGVTTAAIRDVTGTGSEYLSLPGYVSAIAWSPDDNRIMFVLSGKVVVHDVAAQNTREITYIGAPLHVHYASDGATVAFESYDLVEILSADDLTPLANLYPLLSGGYLAISGAGAVDGSPDAREAMVTRATGPHGTSILAGQATWDRFARSDVIACALSGAISAPK